MRRLFRVNSLECLDLACSDDEGGKEADFNKQEINEKIDNVNMDIIEENGSIPEEDYEEEIEKESEYEEEFKENVEDSEIGDEGIEEGEPKGICLSIDIFEIILNFIFVEIYDLTQRVFDPEQLLRNIKPSASFKEYLGKLTHCINRELIDNAVLEFLAHFNRKALRKRLIEHLLKAPVDRLDLLPFYGRFLATLRSIAPDVTNHVLHELLRFFRQIVDKQIETGGSKKILAGFKKIAVQRERTDYLVHLCKYISEMVNF